MQIATFYPEDPVLRQHIAYCYFLRSDDDGFEQAYYSFPNIHQSLNIHRHAVCEIGDNFVTVRGDHSYPPLMILQGRYDFPLQAVLKGRLDKITIVFRPLGLNYFISLPIGEIAPDASQLFTAWEDAAFLKAFFGTADNAARMCILEKFLRQRYTPFPEAPLLEEAIRLLTDFSEEHTVEAVARGLCISTRSFNRLFVQHLGIPPVTFRKIARFRDSLNNKLHSDQFKKLTEIGYQSNFYDQSYFIRMYRKMTGANPSKFYNTIAKLADEQLIFQFISRS